MKIENKLDNVSNGVTTRSTGTQYATLSYITGKNGRIWSGLYELEELMRSMSLLKLLDYLAEFRALLRLYVTHERYSFMN